MEILFKSYHNVYYIDNYSDELLWASLYNFNKINGHVDLYNPMLLDDVEVLYHYRDNKNGDLLPVYYEHNGRFISNDKLYILGEHHTKDYTLVNLKLI